MTEIPSENVLDNKVNESLKKPKITRKLKMPEKKSIFFYLAAFFVPVLIMLIIYIAIGIYPFGQKSLLTIDLYHQYVDFLAYFRSFLLGEANILYSFTKSLGGNLIGLFGYYLGSPLNVILVFFKPEYFSEAVMVLTLIKIGLSSLFFSVMCRHIYKTKDKFVLLFSVCYGLIAYNIVFQQNIMWLDCVMLLPLVVLGLHRLITKNKFGLYVFSLTLTLFSNYYIGYMVCIFSCIYFVYSLIETQNNLTARKFFRKFRRFAFFSILSAGLVTFLLLPVFVSLLNGKANIEANTFTFASNFEFVHLLQKFFIGETDISVLHQGISSTLPDIFSSVFINLMCFLYFFNSKIKAREKFASLVVLFIMILSFNIKFFDLLWHGFNTPIGFLYRNSFIFSFFSIYIGYKAFRNMDGINTKAVLSSIGIMTAISIFVDYTALESLTTMEIFLTLIFFIFYGLLILMLISKKNKLVIFILAIGLLVVEFEVNGFLMLKDLSHVNRDIYASNVEQTQEIVDYVESIDDGFYRMDKTYSRSGNDAMQHNYNAISHSSSTADYEVVNFLNQMGYRTDSDIAPTYQYGSTIPANSLLGIKYIVDDKGRSFPSYTRLTSIEENVIYKNPYALPLMFYGQDAVLSTTEEFDYLSMQNNLFHNLSGEGYVMDKIEEVSVNLINVTESKISGNTTYTKVDSGLEAKVEFTFIAPNDEEVYAHFPAQPISQSTVDVYINNEYHRTFLDSNHLSYYDIMTLGTFEPGESVTLSFVLQNNTTSFDGHFIYSLNSEIMQQSVDSLTENPIEFEMISDSHIVADISQIQKDQVIFTTIPYDEGWSVYVDGKLIEPEIVLDTLMAINAPSGSSTLELKYFPPYLLEGLLISLGAVLMLINILFLKRLKAKLRLKRINKKQHEKELFDKEKILEETNAAKLNTLGETDNLGELDEPNL